MDHFIYYLIIIAIIISVLMIISTVLFCKRVENSWKQLEEFKQKEIETKNINT